MRYHLFRNIRHWDWKAMLGSLLMAAFIWFFDALNRADYSTEITCPVRITHEQPNIVAISPLPRSLELFVEGNGWDLMKLKLGLDLAPLIIPVTDPLGVSGIAFEDFRVKVNEHLGNVRVLGSLEDSLRFTFDSLRVSRLPVMIRPESISLEKDYRLTTPIRLSSDSVNLRLPSAMQGKLPDTLWLTLREEDIADNFSDRITIKEAGGDWVRNPLIRVKPEQIHVRFGVDLFLKQEHRIPIRAINFPNDSTLYLQDSSVRVTYWVRRSNELITPPDESLVIEADYYNMQDSAISYIAPRLPSLYVEPKFSPERLRVRRKETPNDE